MMNFSKWLCPQTIFFVTEYLLLIYNKRQNFTKVILLNTDIEEPEPVVYCVYLHSCFIPATAVKCKLFFVKCVTVIARSITFLRCVSKNIWRELMQLSSCLCRCFVERDHCSSFQRPKTWEEKQERAQSHIMFDS